MPVPNVPANINCRVATVRRGGPIGDQKITFAKRRPNFVTVSDGKYKNARNVNRGIGPTSVAVNPATNKIKSPT